MSNEYNSKRRHLKVNADGTADYLVPAHGDNNWIKNKNIKVGFIVSAPTVRDSWEMIERMIERKEDILDGYDFIIDLRKLQNDAV